MHTAVHGTELVILLIVEAIVAPATIVAAIAYVRIALTAGKDQEVILLDDRRNPQHPPTTDQEVTHA